MNSYLYTLNGYNMYDMTSLYQKAIRRGDVERASFAAHELFYKFNKHLWKRTFIISAEDCDGVITQEIESLYNSQEIVSGGKSEKEPIFISKAIVLLCKCMKNRDADYVGCNLFNDHLKDEIEKEPVNNLSRAELEGGKIPDWTYDVHTLKGKRLGRTLSDMIKSEQEALYPKQRGLFDDASWDYCLKHHK